MTSLKPPPPGPGEDTRKPSDLLAGPLKTPGGAGTAAAGYPAVWYTEEDTVFEVPPVYILGEATVVWFLV